MSIRLRITNSLLFLPALLLAACVSQPVEEGVSRTLAAQRSASLDQLEYHLAFSVPEDPEQPVEGRETLLFQRKGGGPLQLDWRPGRESVLALTVNGIAVEPDCRAEHILLPARLLRRGRNEVKLSFLPEEASLNRHPDYLYSLLVPERARTVFPCFDQPDLKARFFLEAEIPAEWVALSNGPALRDTVMDGRRHLSFAPSGLISTYLFEFTAGRWSRKTFLRGDRPMTVYYRETDPAKVAQLPDIQNQIVYALDWMEDFTGMEMPFEKYDYVIVPGFQFGGMEHPGAILFNDKRLFLGEAPTDADRLARIDLLAHETAHLWFGDAVTMRWFNDVWTKEVFANHFAAMITRPLFPQVDYRLRDFRSFNVRAYQEDRTAGSTPIRQELDNLKDAGLVYGNIVYHKAPVVMRMLADTLGADAFRTGLREYLQTFRYGNATWPELIAILDRHTPVDLAAWSHRWVEEKGMPVYAPSDTLANLSALGYGYYPLTDKGLECSLAGIRSLPEAHQRLSTLANLYENMLHGRLSPQVLAACIDSLLRCETDPLVAGVAIQYLDDVAAIVPQGVEYLLFSLAHNANVPAQIRLTAFRSLVHRHVRPATTAELFSVWESRRPWPGLVLDEADYTTLAYELAIRQPKRRDAILREQRARIANPDRLAAFDFIAPATSPDQAVRDSVFASFLQAENRLVEPWVTRSLALLNHPLRQRESLGYIVPALDALQEVQRTGDIFFPKDWLTALLSDHASPEADSLVTSWITAHPDYPPLLLNKLLQAADPLRVRQQFRSSE